MILLLLPFLYLAYFLFCAIVVLAAVTIYLELVVIVFILTALAMGIRASFRSQWPRGPRRPRFPLRRSDEPIPQARWSNRR